ncbi:hypothetical protein JZ751_010396 [Albula glossodonta]|uniref:Uncharacterized protein n=1 Tax=Albula glossodonta TaxID=121402 RepID=A0A8T2NX05_9TELE|nr:hypothetical protein JZ751_010396 [Albula glossodonta]
MEFVQHARVSTSTPKKSIMGVLMSTDGTFDRIVPHRCARGLHYTSLNKDGRPTHLTLASQNEKGKNSNSK